MKQVYRILGALSLVLFLSLAYGISSEQPALNATVSTDKDHYLVDEAVNISAKVPESTTSHLSLFVPSGDVLTLLSNATGSYSVTYTPREAGIFYAVCTLPALNRSIEANFTVTGHGSFEPSTPLSNATNTTLYLNSPPPGPTKNLGNKTMVSEFRIILNKTVYYSGENVMIDVFAADDVTSSLSLMTPEGDLLGIIDAKNGSFSAVYTPRIAGTYRILCELLDNSTTVSSNFSVVPALGTSADASEPGLELSQTKIILEQINYSVGQNVIIDVNIADGLQSGLSIRTPSGEHLNVIDKKNGSFSAVYTPKSAGKYLIRLEIPAMNKIYEEAFWAYDNEREKRSATPSPEERPFKFGTKRSEFIVGTELAIILNTDKSHDCKIVINTPSGEGMNLASPTDDVNLINFRPNEVGLYHIGCSGRPETLYSFLVLPEAMPDDVEERIMVRRSDKSSIGVDAFERFGGGLKLVPQESDILSIEFNGLNKSSLMYLGLDEFDLSTSQFGDNKTKTKPARSLSLRVIENGSQDDSSTPNLGPNVARLFAIDPSRMDFENATVTLVARGDTLYKCRDWIFENQSCPKKKQMCTEGSKAERECTIYGGWKKIKKMVPGEPYNFTIDTKDPGFAEYVTKYGAPYCANGESPCYANSTLLKCRNAVTDAYGPEPNEPNTIDDCTDGGATFETPSCGGDESVENITVTDLNGTYFMAGDTVRVSAWFHCWGATDDHLGLYYTNDSTAPTPVWKQIEFLEDGCPSAGFNEITFSDFKLDDMGGKHAVRVYITYDTAATPTEQACAANAGYDDNDDVMFLVRADPAQVSNAILLTGAGGNVDLATDQDITWTTDVRIDDTYFRHPTNSHSITVKEDGLYRMTYGLHIQSATTNDRYQVLAHANVDDSDSLSCYSSGYNRGLSGSGDLVAVGECILNLSENQNISIAARRVSTLNAAGPSIVSDESWFQVQRLDNPAVIMLKEAGGGDAYDVNDITITFDGVDLTDSSYSFTGGSDEVTVTREGFYRISYGVGVTHNSNSRASAFGNLQVDPGAGFADVPYGWSHSNQRGADNCRDAALSTSTILNLSKGDKIRLKVGRASEGDPGTLSIVGGRIHMDIEYLGPKRQANVFLGYDAAGGDDLEPGPVDQTWDTLDYAGPSYSYTPTGSEVTVLEDGLYHLSYGIYTNRTDGSTGRFEWGTFIRVNDLEQDICLGSGYNRGDQPAYNSTTGASESSCLIQLSANDRVEVRNIETSTGTGTIPTTGDRIFLNIQNMDFDTWPKVIWNWSEINTTDKSGTTNVSVETDEAVEFCNLTVNGTTYLMDGSGYNHWYVLSYLPAGNYTLWANCTDKLGGHVGNSTIAWWNNKPPDYNLTFLFNGTVTDAYGYQNGTLDGTFYNLSLGAIQLLPSYTTGNYTSQVFDATMDAIWNNISWISNTGELPGGLVVEDSFAVSGINMSSNVFLYHLNNDSRYGESNSLVSDFSGNGNDAIPSATATPTPSGRFSGAYDFDGTQTTGFINTTWYPDDGAHTMSFWINWDSVAGYQAVGTHDQNDHRFYMGINGANTYWGAGDTWEDTDVTGMTAGRWYHMAMTMNGTDAFYYINGTQIATLSYTWTATETSAKAFLIGQMNGYGIDVANRAVDGQIDEFAVWDRALSADEIGDIYRRGSLSLNLSVRNCTAPTCPDGTWQKLSGSSPQELTLDGRYFQYLFEFYTENTSFSPELHNVTIDYTMIPPDTTPPNVTLNLPQDNYYNHSSLPVLFNCSVTDDRELENISLYYTDPDGSNFIRRATRTISGNNTSVTWKLNLPRGNYTWNCVAYDEGGNKDWADANRSFELFSCETEPNEYSRYSGYSEYYIACETQDFWDVLEDLDGAAPLDPVDGLHTSNTFTATVDNTTLYYDHWEDGYDFDPDNPSASADEIVLLSEGEVRHFESSNVDVSPRGTATFYDCADRIYVAGGPVIATHATWPESTGAVYAVAFEVYPTKALATSYTLPVGEDLFDPPTNYIDFDKVYLMVGAIEDNTEITIDDPNNAGVEVSTILNEGESYTLYNANSSTTITASSKISANFVVGRQDVQYELRGYAMVPQNLWSSEYYSPVPGFVAADTTLYIYNPNNAQITIVYEDSTGSGRFNISAKSTRSYDNATGSYVPTNSGVYLKSEDDKDFWAIGSVDVGSRSYDWGYSLIPAYLLTRNYFVGWALGSSNSPPTESGSPVFVTPVESNTRLYVDFSPVDGIVDRTYDLDRLDTVNITDPDFDNTGMHIWTEDLKEFAVAWGQHPDIAAAGVPYLDMGYTTLPLPPDWIDIVLSIDVINDPKIVAIEEGQISNTTLLIKAQAYPVDNVTAYAEVPKDWKYVPGSTVISFSNGTVLSGASAEPAIVARNLSWNLNASLGQCEYFTIDFQINSTENITEAYYWVEAEASGSRFGGTQVFTPQSEDYIFAPSIIIDKDTKNPLVNRGDTVNYTILVKNLGNISVNNVSIFDNLPSGFVFLGATIAANDSNRTAIIADPAPLDTNLFWGYWNISSNGSVKIEFRVNVTDSAVRGTYDNNAYANSSKTGVIDDIGAVGQDAHTPPGKDPGDDEDVLVDVVTDVAITKVAKPDSVRRGDYLLYTINVTNNGPEIADYLNITDILPESVVVNSVSPIQNGSSGRVYWWNVTRLLVGNTYTIEINVTPNDATTIYNYANVTGGYRDSNTDNDEANISTDVILMWHFFCGNVSGRLILANSIAEGVDIFYNWTWEGSGNIYSYSTGADISWDDLVALGRTTTGLASTDDFEEADFVLNTIFFVNNTNDTYSSDGSAALKTRSFVIATETVSNVPIANSSYSDAFVTGVLWDSSDDLSGNLEFDQSDNEDLVFVTAINRSAISPICSQTDFELRLPTTFDTYKGLFGTVSFLAELF